MKGLIIGSDNLDEAYDPAPGQAYKIDDDCIRSFPSKITYGMDRKASELMAKENVLETDPNSETFSPNLRLQVVELVTEGDDMPADIDNIDMLVIGRIVADFFSFRIARGGKRKSL